MKRFSAQFIFTNTAPPLKRAVITAEDDGTIVKVEERRGELKETQSVEFYNGIIVPGFVNCHCHLELSHLKGAIAEGMGLSDFIMNVRTLRNYDQKEIITAAKKEDDDLFREGVSLCADICNTPVTFDIKKRSSIRYISFGEVFGIDPDKAGKRMVEVMHLAKEAEDAGLKMYPVPHSAYSVSLPLFRMLREKSSGNRVTSVHFMESESEAIFLKDHSGPMRRSYADSGLLPASLQMPENHVRAIMDEVTLSGNLILVHNTYADRNTVSEVKKRGNTYWCLCPGSNLYIENKLPPVEMLMEENCEIVIGTDSLSSNKKLSILREMGIIQERFTSVKLEELIRWATVNGAEALGEGDGFGTIEPGKRPGLILLQDLDLVNLRLLEETTVRRLI
jgi:cytosine/adenosine deaminase-related metal-dependent hydrolase